MGDILFVIPKYKDLNVEYGYYTTEAPPSGHEMGHTTFHDFKDARDDDEIKSKIDIAITLFMTILFGLFEIFSIVISFKGQFQNPFSSISSESLIISFNLFEEKHFL